MKHRHHLAHQFHHHSTPDQPGEIPLNTLQTGEKGVVISIIGGQGMQARITSLGFVPGTEVVILRNFPYGPIIVRAHDARIALGRGVAGRIRIRRSEARTPV